MTIPWAVAAIVVFVVVDAVLIWWAVTSLRAEAGAPQGEVLPTIPPASPGPTTTDEPNAASSDATPAPVIRQTVMLAALDANVAYRGSTGTCPGVAASIEVTLDGGATWDAGVTEGLTDLQSLDPSEGEIVTMIARDAACTIGRYRSYVLGDDWEATSEPEPTWYVDGGQAVAPSGISLPCDGAIAQLASTSPTSAAVLCESGEVLVTSDAGVVWAATATPVSGAVALAGGPTGYLVAVTGDGCRGIRIAVVDLAAEDEPQPGACLEADPAPGTTAIDVAPDGTLWAWTGGVLARSADGGATW
ncbi:hypothetical protein [Agromyces sp. Leaf222]|uniref:hypothetical protein n=1 Tax=Agromyces sp. Leaf222 TaxID=1735688 RepID=UPI0006FF6DD8|nr:hypothetical protein [Agromyces sp. Leaf222]KQM82766.1 hypothetical protein ASE68_05400 [Agromyces sp. Leaf222]